MSSFLIPATLTGLFTASLLKGSPSSWLRITSINVVIPFFDLHDMTKQNIYQPRSSHNQLDAF